MIVLLVIALAVTITVLVVKPDSNSPSATPTTNGADSDFASANDTGPVNIITEDPTCDAWGKISREYVEAVNRVDWTNRDPSVAEADWDPQLQSKYDTAVSAMRTAANKAQSLVKLTPHRVTRELYEQLIAYTNSFASAVPTYVAKDNSYAVAVTNISSALSVTCSAIAFDVSQAYFPILPKSPAPTNASQPQTDVAKPARFLEEPNTSCASWREKNVQFERETTAWKAIDPSISASDWTPEQRRTVDEAIPQMSQLADDLQRLGVNSENQTFEDFAIAGSQYLRAYVLALPQYTAPDNYLSSANIFLSNTVMVACEAVE